MSAAGIWNLSIATPIGKQAVVLELFDHDGALGGTATGAGETVDLANLILDGDRLSWTQSITKPVELDLAFDVTIDGDTLEGTAKAGPAVRLLPPNHTRGATDRSLRTHRASKRQLSTPPTQREPRRASQSSGTKATRRRWP